MIEATRERGDVMCTNPGLCRHSRRVQLPPVIPVEVDRITIHLTVSVDLFISKLAAFFSEVQNINILLGTAVVQRLGQAAHVQSPVAGHRFNSQRVQPFAAFLPHSLCPEFVSPTVSNGQKCHKNFLKKDYTPNYTYILCFISGLSWM